MRQISIGINQSCSNGLRVQNIPQLYNIGIFPTMQKFKSFVKTFTPFNLNNCFRGTVMYVCMYVHYFSYCLHLRVLFCHTLSLCNHVFNGLSFNLFCKDKWGEDRNQETYQHFNLWLHCKKTHFKT